jgi:hypothetical protein
MERLRETCNEGVLKLLKKSFPGYLFDFFVG